MDIKSVLREVKEIVRPDAQTLKEISARVGEFAPLLKKELAKNRIDAEVFIGGSFARGTLIKKEWYDIDIFVRCNLKYDNPSEVVGRAVLEVGKKIGVKIERVHGSRDYFRAIYPKGKFVIEVIPVLRIKKPQEEKNVTDLSYFHVNYVKKNIKNLQEDVRLAKQFCIAQDVYGAESYIKGFSGYGLECLVIHYNGFLNMLKKLSKVNEKIIIDSANHYKKGEAMVRINESKLMSPIILIDPTYKERNALAALSEESFAKFKRAAQEFLKKPSIKFFEKSEDSYEELQKLARSKKAEMIKVIMTTNRQAGDIAGTKLKKFSAHLEQEVRNYFDMHQVKFEYNGADEAILYVVAKARKAYTKFGPPVKMLKAVAAFKKANKKTVVSAGKVIAVIPINFTLKEHLVKISKDTQKLSQMAITKIIVEN